MTDHTNFKEHSDASGVASVISQSAEAVASIINDVSIFPEVFHSPTPSIRGGDEDLQQPIDSDEEDWEDLDFGEFIQPKTRKVILDAIKSRILSQLSPDLVLLRDKISFTVGTLDLFISAYWLGHDPQTFHKLYTVKVVLMLIFRWIYYRATLQHYYLFDMCYALQALLMIQIYLCTSHNDPIQYNTFASSINSNTITCVSPIADPTSITLAKTTFAFSMGPLLWSILAFRNSLVLHSLDKVTSLFLHWFPGCVVWAYRWHPPPRLENYLQENPSERSRWEDATMWELCILPMGPYLVWAILYYLKIFVVSSKKIQRRGYETLFQYVTTRRGIFSAIILRFTRSMQPIVYIIVHMILTALAMAFNTVWWKSKTAGSCFVLAAFGLAAWNGACFYFHVFAHRYLMNLGIESSLKKQH